MLGLNLVKNLITWPKFEGLRGQAQLPSTVPVPVSSLAELSFSLISASDPPPQDTSVIG